MKTRALILILFVACVPARALKQCETEQGVALRHQANTELPLEAIAIAEDAEDAWAAQLYLLDGTRLPPAVEARLAARDGLPEGYAK